MKAPFIVLEGCDGSSKSTQARRLAGALRAAGYVVSVEIEPTDGPIGRLIREMTRAGSSADPRTLALLFAADRMEHSRKIRALLSDGIVVICDRYALSTAVYQGAVSGDLEVGDWADTLSAYACPPDLTLVLDAPIEVCAERLRARGKPADAFEQPDVQWRVHQAYRRAESYRWGSTVVRVDASGTEAVVAARVLAAVESRIAERERAGARITSRGAA